MDSRGTRACRAADMMTELIVSEDDVYSRNAGMPDLPFICRCMAVGNPDHSWV